MSKQRTATWIMPRLVWLSQCCFCDKEVAFEPVWIIFLMYFIWLVELLKGADKQKQSNPAKGGLLVDLNLVSGMSSGEWYLFRLTHIMAEDGLMLWILEYKILEFIYANKGAKACLAKLPNNQITIIKDYNHKNTIESCSDC